RGVATPGVTGLASAAGGDAGMSYARAADGRCHDSITRGWRVKGHFNGDFFHIVLKKSAA
ncbi:hypothetical protein, partial [Cronobacter sakazakii]|uniref:hypothetical protein n=1 Tax=Cronobacter sakazakii TaxID=28141 RepID=UPI00195E95B8